MSTCPPPSGPAVQIMVLSTFLPIVAGRLGLAPTATRHTTPGLRLYEDKSAGLISGDPAGAARIGGEDGFASV